MRPLLMPSHRDPRGRGRAGPHAAASILASLILASCKVAALQVTSPPPSSSPCPSSCLCASDIVSCSGRNLSAPPPDIPAFASWLDLGHNALTAVPTVADWTGGGGGGVGARQQRPLFRRLATLVLGWNAIDQVAPGAFAATPRLRHLDLSFNRLDALNTSAFRGLAELEVLLLFGNRISQADPGAFVGLHRLRKLYLSGNRLQRFPLEVYRDSSNLTFLDLSSNMLSEVPIQNLLALPDHQQSGVYLQGNPLVCDCALLALLEFWTLREYRPVLDFSNDYPCWMTTGGGGGGGGRQSLHCGVSHESAGKTSTNDLRIPGGVTQRIEPGDRLQLPCPGLTLLLPTSPAVQPSGGGGGGEPVFFWITPGGVLRRPSRSHGANEGGGSPPRLTILPSGALEIQGAAAEDTGVYTCVAARGLPPGPRSPFDDNPAEGLTLLVGSNASVPRAGAPAGSLDSGHFNTAFTTLASCVVSIVLVLLYLYLTPCCYCGREGGGNGGGRAGRRCRFCCCFVGGRVGRRALLLCSDPSDDHRGSSSSSNNGKRVAFLEPHHHRVEKCEAKTPPPPAHGGTATEGILKNGVRTV